MMKFLALWILLTTPCFANDEAPASEWIQAVLQKGSELKKQGLWDEQIKLGEQAIESCKEKGLLKEEARLTAQLASTYFYRGDYLRTTILSERSLAICHQISDEEGVISSLYLLSAAKRGLKNYAEAILCAEQALILCSQEDTLKAKVLFNLAAALSDQDRPDIERALEHLQHAQALFLAAKDEDYLGRTSLRIARLYILQNKPVLAMKILSEASSHFHQDRVWMHYHYLMAQALRKIGLEDGAIQEAQVAKVLAVRLQAQEDLNRIENFINEKG